MKFLEFLDARCFDLRAAERRFEILKFLSARRFGFRTTTGFLNFMPAPRNGFRILKFARASARLANTAQNFISWNRFKILKLVCEPLRALHSVLPRVDSAETRRGCGIAEKRRAVKLTYASGYLNFMRCRIVRLYGAAARHGYEVGRAEKFSKFSLAATLLNFISLPPHKFKPALLKFTRELRKFKPASAVRLNFALNSVPPVRAVKFENGVKFRAAAKFKRSAR